MLHCYRAINGPFLVVVPNSTLQNWINEIERFCPSLRTKAVVGEKTKRKKLLKSMKIRRWDVCVTTYEMCLIEKFELNRYKWRLIVVDEAHRIKNERAKLSRQLRYFTSVNRLLLTGTPLQNNLHELWAMLNFLLPDIFASADDFDTWFDSDDCLSGNIDLVARIQAVLKPFMLRRLKIDVEKQLLPKKELKLFIGLTPLQRDLYTKILKKDLSSVIGINGKPSVQKLNQIMMALRKASNHPFLIDGVESDLSHSTDESIINSCGKMMVLDQLLQKLISQGSRVLLFSQFVGMLNILEDYLTWRKFKFVRLDGTTAYDERAENIDKFNAENGDVFVFIISTRAGGLGKSKFGTVHK